MSGKFHKKTSNILVVLIVGIMIIGLVFSFQFERGGNNTVAKVGPYQITNREFNNEFNRQVEFYTQLFGGRSLNQAQIEQFRVRENALQNLIQRKLMLVLGDELGVTVTSPQIKARIKELPYFLTNEQFDINKYKQLLRMNGLTPADFEADIKQEIKQQTTYQLVNHYPVSKGYIEDFHQFKAQELKGDIIQIDTNQLMQHIPVTDNEIKEYLSAQVNFERVENLFKERKPSLDQPEQVKASHILVKEEKLAKELAAKAKSSNFSKLATQHTEDVGSKEQGGSLGWFARGRMAPEFEKAAFALKAGQVSSPVKTNFGYHIILVEAKKPAVESSFNDYKNRIAKELIQKQKTDELKKLTDSITTQAQQYLQKGQTKQLSELAKQYGLTFQEDLVINPIEGVQGSMLLSSEHIQNIFQGGLKQNKTYIFKQPTKVIVAKIEEQKEKSKLNAEEDRENLQTAFARKLVQDAVKAVQDSTSVKVYAQL